MCGNIYITRNVSGDNTLVVGIVVGPGASWLTDGQTEDHCAHETLEKSAREQDRG